MIRINYDIRFHGILVIDLHCFREGLTMSLKQMLLTAPDSQLDHSMVPLIEKWDPTPTSIQILEVLDKIIFASLASGVVVKLLQIELDLQMKKENIQLEDLLPQASWRKPGAW